MNNNKTKATIMALVALVVVCGGSFLGVKLLNNKADTVVTAPVITTQSQTTTETVTTTVPIFTDAVTLPVATTADFANKETTTEKETESETTKLNQYTTFANVDRQTTASSSSVQNITTASATTEEEKEAQETIESAAVFSDGFLSFLFNKDGDYYYTQDDPWQRQLGFNELYDLGAPFIIFYYDTMRCKFTYDNKDWLIQFWKGQYGLVFLGGEIGVYNKPTDREAEHYDCASDEDALYMSMTFYRKGEEKLTREYAKYWWCTGFVPGKLDKFSDRSELSIRARLTMKDQRMLLAFCNALKGNGLNLNEDFTVNGLDVFVVW